MKKIKAFFTLITPLGTFSALDSFDSIEEYEHAVQEYTSEYSGFFSFSMKTGEGKVTIFGKDIVQQSILTIEME